ncbi:hypothetical protein OH76DRAFT_1351312 [Lentinus brumalis]|uniref:BTB domain-containing protein n=1 Tax=Lentinus brumalis TaxID=2498619 RepID=A0A371D901_9APHY|nr:hypothetical protein OH76DRAFT_1351312 [Polyporus brumalis]
MSASGTPRKRARLDGPADDEPPQSPQPDANPEEPMANDGSAAEYTRDAEFWLEDGTVILVAGDVEFRVYSGLLAKHSPRLKELFSDTQCTRTLLVDGRSEISCPVVCLTDSPDDLRHLLRAYMPQDASNIYEYEYPSFDAVSASIRLGHKYQIMSLYDRSLEFLRENFPDDFDTYDKLNQWVPTGWAIDDAIGVVNLARLIGETTLLPTALLACTTLGEQIVRGYQRQNGMQEHLTIDDQALCIKAKIEIRKARVATLFRVLCPAPAKTCKNSSGCRTTLRKAVYNLHSTIDDWLGDTGDPFTGYKTYIKGGKLDVCEVCLPMVEATSVAERRKLWNRLPLLLGIQVPGWGVPPPAPQSAPVQS